MGLAERARLAQRLEGAVLDGNGEAAAVLAEEVASAWETLAPIRDKGLAAVTARYELALAAARGDADAQTRIRAAAADGVVREREMVCLDLEIATGIESPAEFSQERMKKQIDRLQASMTGVAADGEAAVDELMRRWFSLGPVPAEARARLDDRFERILAAAVTTTSRRPPR
jgi:exonuclease SbcC